MVGRIEKREAPKAKAKAKKRLTNVQLLKEICDHSKYGALAQAFVMDSLQQHAEAVAASRPDQYPENSFIHPEAWIGVAKEILEKLKQD